MQNQQEFESAMVRIKALYELADQKVKNLEKFLIGKEVEIDFTKSLANAYIGLNDHQKLFFVGFNDSALHCTLDCINYDIIETEDYIPVDIIKFKD